MRSKGRGMVVAENENGDDGRDLSGGGPKSPWKTPDAKAAANARVMGADSWPALTQVQEQGPKSNPDAVNLPSSAAAAPPAAPANGVAPPRPPTNVQVWFCRVRFAKCEFCYSISVLLKQVFDVRFFSVICDVDC